MNAVFDDWFRLQADNCEAGLLNEPPAVFRGVAAEVHGRAEPVTLHGARIVLASERRDQQATRLEPFGNASHKTRELAKWQMIERVERGHRIETVGRKRYARHVRTHERGVVDCLTRELNLAL